VVHLSRDDSPILLTYSGTTKKKRNGIHHAIFGARFKEQATNVGAPCILDLPKQPALSDKAPNWREFLLEHLRL